MPSSPPSSSSSPTTHAQLTPESDSPDSDESNSDSGSDLDVHSHHSDEAYELQKLPARTDNERDRLLEDSGDAGEEFEVGEEVLYDEEGGESDGIRWRRRRRTESTKGFLYTKEEERTVVKRLDWYLVGALAVLYMLSFLDRSNIGNARIAGMEEDLELIGTQYEWLLTSFYITYICFEWMTLCWKVFSAHKYVAFCVVGWGIIASLQALSVTWFGMLILRALLGISEAAFGPGVPFYLSLFYRREELALRTGLFISSAPLATAYAGFLAYAITSIASPIASWRLLFILEGFPSIIAGICAFYLIPDAPGEAWFLDRDQRKIARRRLLVVRDDEEDSGKIVGQEEGRRLKWGEIWKALKDKGNWITAMIFFFANVSFASLPVFLPTIIHEMGYESTTAQALSTPPYLFGFVVIIAMTYLSDRFRSRSVPLLILCTTSACGYLLLAMAGALQKSLTALPGEIAEVESPGAGWLDNIPSVSFLSESGYTTGMRYTGVMMAAGTIFATIALVIVWNGNNSETESGRGAGMALLQGLGQCGPLLGTRLYPSDQGPEYIPGSLVCAGCMVIVCILVGVQRWRLKRENRRREKEEARLAGLEGGNEMERKKTFRFML